MENDKKVLEYDLENATKINDNFNEMITLINKHEFHKQNIPNIGIYYNNKIVEVYKLVNEKGVQYSKSTLKNALIVYMNHTIIEPAFAALNSFVEKNNAAIPTIKRAFFNKEVAKEEIDKYFSYCDILKNFDIEKEASKVLNYSVDDYMIQFYYAGDANEYVDQINEEAKKLDIEVNIEHRKNADIKSSEIITKLDDKVIKEIRERINGINNDAKSIKADEMIQKMVEGKIDTNGEPIMQNQEQISNDRQMGYVKIWILGLIVTVICLGIVILGMALIN